MFSNRRHRFALLVIALIVRLPAFLSGSWYDENFSLLVARLPFERMMLALMGDVHPPLFYLVSWLAVRLGDSILLVRLPALCFSLLTLWILPALFTRLQIPDKVQTGALVIFALAPFQIQYSTEARMYALLQLLMVCGVWAVLSRRWLLTFVSVLALAYTHNWGLFYGVTLGLLAVLTSPLEWKKFVPAFILAAVGWLPWGLVMFWQMSAIHANYWITRLSLGQILYALHEQIWTITLATVPGLLGTAAWMIAGVWSARKLPAAWRLYLLVFAPVCLAVLVSIFWQSIILFRAMIGISPFLYVLLSCPLLFVRKSELKRNALVALIVILPMSVISVRQLSTGNLRGLPWFNSPAQSWTVNVKPGDTIITNTDTALIDYKALWPSYPVQLLEQCRPPLGSLTRLTRSALGYSTVAWDAIPSGRVWVIYAESALSANCEAWQFHQLLNGSLLVYSDPLNNQFISTNVWMFEK